MRVSDGILSGLLIGTMVGGAAVAGLMRVKAQRALRMAVVKTTDQEQMFGHYRYPLASSDQLEAVEGQTDVLLRHAAARAFRSLQTAANADGILLIPVSGYRDLARQRRLFFAGAALRGQRVLERAEVCAPPGFSEHHTGYSLDLGDGAYRETQLKLQFKDTDAFTWLRQHAARYHFEMSFPPGNPQGVAYEPWHWRYVGDEPSLETFYLARLGRLPK